MKTHIFCPIWQLGGPSMPQNTPTRCRIILPTRGTHSEKIIFSSILGPPRIRQDPSYPARSLGAWYPYKLFLACRSCRRRFFSAKKHVPGFLEVSQGRNRWYFLIFPHMTPPPPPPGDDGGDGDGGGGTPPANPTPIPNVGRDKITRSG